MFNQKFRNYIFPLLFNLLFTLFSVFSSNSIILSTDTLLIIAIILLIPSTIYYILFFTFGLLFRKNKYRFLFILTITYILVGLVFKILHWPFATWMLYVCVLLLLINLIYWIKVKGKAWKYLYIQDIHNYYIIKQASNQFIHRLRNLFIN